MPPTRRYIRLSPHHVIEARIHMKRPADTTRWLLHSSHPALGRVLEAVRPILGLKLREESRRRGGKGGKKKVQDRVEGEDFEAIVFLLPVDGEHVVLGRQRMFGKEKGGRGGRKDDPMMVEAEMVVMEEIPAAMEQGGEDNEEENEDEDEEFAEEEKKLGLKTSYRGFKVHDQILTLVVTRKEKKAVGADALAMRSSNGAESGKEGPGAMEEWIASTQRPD